MSNIIIRTRSPKTEGGNLDDVQISFVVEAIDEDTGAVLHSDNLWISSKGVKNDPEIAATVSNDAAALWADTNAAVIQEKVAILETKSQEIAVSQPILDAIISTPDQVKPKEEILSKANLILEEAVLEEVKI